MQLACLPCRFNKSFFSYHESPLALHNRAARLFRQNMDASFPICAVAQYLLLKTANRSPVLYIRTPVGFELGVVYDSLHILAKPPLICLLYFLYKLLTFFTKEEIRPGKTVKIWLTLFLDELLHYLPWKVESG